MNDKERLEKENILYRPVIDYDKSYDTVGAFSRTESEDKKEETSYNTLENLKDKIDNIDSAMSLLPDDLADIAKKPFEAIKHVIGDISDDPKKIPLREETIIINSSKEPEEIEDIYPESPFRKDETPIRIEITRNDKIEVIKKEYEYDLVSIIDDYINSLDIVMDKYMKNILSLMTGIEPGLYPKIMSKYELNTSKVSTNNKHLSDIIIRSQISRSMRSRMYNKLFNIDKTITHIRMCKIGVQQRLRYYEASYTKDDTFDNTISNRMLEHSRMLYDKKYKQNFINLYKYLNSSVMVLDECFNMFINEAQAKIILMKKEGFDLW